MRWEQAARRGTVIGARPGERRGAGRKTVRDPTTLHNLERKSK